MALLGAGGQIGRGLATEFADRHEMFLFSRKAAGAAHPYGRFPQFEYDVVINAAGPGDPAEIRESAGDIFRVTEFFDNLVLDYLDRHADTLYVFLSSGAIYLNQYAEAVRIDSNCTLPVNRLEPAMFYPIAKLHAEAKHRAAARHNIADIRIFGYFSRHIRLSSGFFLAEVADAIVTKRTLRTTRANTIRDYISAADLARLIECIARHGQQNQAYDLVSLAPVAKSALLSALVTRFGLRLDIEGSATLAFDDVTPLASLSDHQATQGVGYSPVTTSLDLVMSEMQAIVDRVAPVPRH